MTDCGAYAPKELQTSRSLQTRSLERLTLLEAADFLHARSRGEMFAMPYMAAEAPFAHDGMISGDEFIDSHLELPRALGLHGPFWARIIDYREGADVIYMTEESAAMHGVMGIVLYPDGDAPGEGPRYWRAVHARSGTETAERNYLYYSMRPKQTYYGPDRLRCPPPRSWRTRSTGTASNR
ncbi:hypothetical protein OG883_35895 [Streptomyces sp. NBC_01142]|uniref:hypothetical protein n=1 Tax=Streptomyces sp. NBC_01142 TaxID=2975865 RepID=UPI00224EAE2E|nr:hypothetical protein [Streptomyces sp. NBC_01142]MCX4825151.1 hypothetical protein [Streptomyces sp. NBC_01142]